MPEVGDVKPTNNLKVWARCGHWSSVGVEACMSCQDDMVRFVREKYFDDFKDWKISPKSGTEDEESSG